MKEVIEIINKLQSTNGTNDKLAILKENKDNETFKQVLYYTYADNLMYGFSENKLRESLKEWKEKGIIYKGIKWFDIFSMLDELSQSNINDNLRTWVYQTIARKDVLEEELYIRILTKDLRCNISAKTINKAIPKLIPTWDIQQAYAIDKVKLNKDEWIALSLKLNGIRGTYFKDIIKSRQNKEMLGLEHIIKDIQSIDWLKDYVVDGEMIRKNIDNVSDNENFRLTSSILNSDDNDKSEIGMVIFDLIPVDEFIKGQSKKGFKDRLEDLNKLREYIEKLGLKNLTIAPTYYTGTDHSKIDELLDEVDSKGYEGLMCLRNMPYKTKRNNGILKCKKFKEGDFKIIGFEQGKGKFSNTLGSLVVEFKGNSVGVSGFTDNMRDEFWNNQDKYLGSIITVKYKEESKDKNTGLPSLQFPTFVMLRPDKTEPNY